MILPGIEITEIGLRFDWIEDGGVFLESELVQPKCVRSHLRARLGTHLVAFLVLSLLSLFSILISIHVIHQALVGRSSVQDGQVSYQVVMG